MSKDQLIIFDTTLRDGEQSPGASMTRDEKVHIAKMLEKMRVDVIEAGFAIASPGDFAAVKAVAEAVKDSTICSLARANDADIDAAGEAIAPANSGRIHTFIATSPIHMKYKLRMEPDAVVERAVDAIKRASRYTDNIEFSCEDASRTEFDFMCRIIERVIDAGATTINIPDTVGYGEPNQYGDTMGRLIANIPNSDKAIFSVHCHNDLGLAVANSLSAVMQGARQVECTINGLGERAGNASLEELVMAIKTRHDLFNVQTNIDTTQIVPTSRLVSSITGFPVQPNKAIVGANAFAHESGIHQDGVLKHRETYEIMSAESVGWNTNRLVLGKHSGRAAFKARLEELGYGFEEQADINEVFARFKQLADKKHEIFDEDLHALMNENIDTEVINAYQLVYLDASSKTGEKPTAKLVINDFEGVEKSSEAEGSGTVDAAFKAIEAVVNSGCELTLYTVNAVTEGTDSIGGVTVRLEKNGHIVNGQGANTDIIVASAEAYLDALNLMKSGLLKAHPQHQGV
ncbi:2-isopropylmalate synthase [Sinobacterium norvegicum]|uniref:2-isopropylmalate synthase n=1 Tax=Sinobacterium norvegicum TaxID=1641715 RepID=A0ABM9AGF5_9GAMM|nr:2-isopropylmalate synthase [Sinobacterium norvegicum]CAH0992288.1 2-isopropylmalate synthase [Sinobacterium norvegicum]